MVSPPSFGRPYPSGHVPVEALEHQVAETAGPDASVFPLLMLSVARGDDLSPAPEWLRPRATAEDYLRGVLA